MNGQNHLESFEIVARVLARCFIGGVLLLLLWFFMVVCCGDRLYALNVKWFPVSREQFALVNFCGIAVAKLFVYFVFLVPYISLRLVLRKMRK